MLISKQRLVILGLIGIILSSITSAKAVQPRIKEIQISKSAIKDDAVINKERIIYWLIKRGELNSNATEEEKSKALKKYITGTQTNKKQYIDEINGKPVVNFTNIIKKNSSSEDKSSALQRTENKLDTHEVNVLVLLIDFPDLPHDDNQLVPDDTAMYYQNYTTEHYQNLMFSPTGFTGPNNETLASAHQYYASESGNSFHFNGKVYDWVTADHNAEYYGANDANGNDQAATDLIKEALNKAVVKYQIDLSKFDLVDPADLDGDGIINEPDGYIDYLMVFHSSIGADAGGGLLGTDAIWAHRWNVNNYEIPNTNYKDNRGYRAHGYTIQGIDSAIGVVSHEFGHMVANLLDEYDTNNSIPNSPVGFWSMMSGGSWGGDTIPGSKPTGFSPLAKVQLQNAFGGNWINTNAFDLNDLKQAVETVNLVEAVNHGTDNNLVSIELPASGQQVVKPFAGEGQFHSSAGDNLYTSMNFEVSLSSAHSSIVSMKAYWDIEQDWDYAQILVNGRPIAANHTKLNNVNTDSYDYLGLIEHYLSGKSALINAGWVDLTIDLSNYANKTVVITLNYITDSNNSGTGLFIDDITLISDDVTNVIDSAEGENKVHLNGFTLTPIFVEDKFQSQRYYIQLRSHNGVDEGLNLASYDHGILMWLADDNFTNNQSSLHPGQGFLSVIDADQNLIKDDQYGIWWTTNQVRDAVFSLYTQQEKSADHDLHPISIFNDSYDYIQPEQPESGVLLPIHGLSMEVIEQASDSSSAKLKFSLDTLTLTPSFNINKTNKTTVHFNNKSYGGQDWLHYRWNFGDGSPESFENNPIHTYDESGEYTVTLEVTDASGAVSLFDKKITTQGVSFEYNKNALTVNFINTSRWGNDTLEYLWDFGDGTQSSEISPVHTYQSSGDYSVILKATSMNGEELAIEKIITVVLISPPQPSFTITSNFLKVQTVNKTTGGTGKLKYTWDFGDGSYQKIGTSPIHIYSEPGTYNVSLRVEDALGRGSIFTHFVIVEKAKKKKNGGSTSFLALFFILLTLLKRVLIIKAH